MTRSARTAADLSTDLAKDPEHLARVAERDRRIAARLAEMAPEQAQIAKEAAQLGYKISAVSDFINNSPHPFLPRPFVGPYERAYPLLIKHLAIPHHPAVRESIIRALTVRDGGDEVAQALLDQFYVESDHNLRWVLANALKVAMPLRKRKLHPEIARVYKGDECEP